MYWAARSLIHFICGPPRIYLLVQVFKLRIGGEITEKSDANREIFRFIHHGEYLRYLWGWDAAAISSNSAESSWGKDLLLWIWILHV